MIYTHKRYLMKYLFNLAC